MCDDTKKNSKCGYVAVAGRPNTGKSTLINHILGQKLSIVTHKPQTTRDEILAVFNDSDTQIVFMDTPGLHKSGRSLGKHMNTTALNSVRNADLCLWMIDGADKKRRDGLTEAERIVGDLLAETGIPTVVALNKVDIVKPRERILPLLQTLNNLDFCQAIIPISARTGDGVDTLLNEIIQRIPEGSPIFPSDQVTNKPTRFFSAELVREAIIKNTQQEVPYRTAVVIDKFSEYPESIEIFASIHVETKGQKKILIGKGGEMIGLIREKATEEIASMLDAKVTLRLQVNLSPDWSTNPAGLRKMGYE